VSRFVERAAADVTAGKRVLDAGAGEGPYRALFAHARYVALDDRRGEARWNYGGLDVVGDLARMPFRDAAFDAVLCTETLEHLTDPQTFLGEAARVLRPGGRLFLTAPLQFRVHLEPNDYFRYTRHGLALLLGRAGFVDASVEPEGGYFRFLGDKIQPAHRMLFRKDRALAWRILFLPLQPFSMLFFTVIAPAVCVVLDPLDRERRHTTGFLVRAAKR
jgi:SAM-dependent methyltransferase